MTGRAVIAELDPEVDRYLVVQALRDAVIFRFREAAEPCQACLSHPVLLCVTCQGALDLASGYRALIGRIAADGGSAGQPDLASEYQMADGAVVWTVHGPKGKPWSIVWNPVRGNLRAWPFPGGRTSFHLTAIGDLESARKQALTVAAQIAQGRRLPSRANVSVLALSGAAGAVDLRRATC